MNRITPFNQKLIKLTVGKVRSIELDGMACKFFDYFYIPRSTNLWAGKYCCDQAR